MSALRAGFTGDVLARPDAPRAGDAREDPPRFQRPERNSID